MLVNLSNTVYGEWLQDQQDAATEKYGKIVDVPFPNISPDWSTKEVKSEAKKYCEIILGIIEMSEDKKNAVIINGELSFTFMLMNRLKKEEIPVVVPTFMLKTKGEEEPVTKQKFLMFRKCF